MFECIWAHDLCNQRKTYGARFERHGQITSGTPSVRHWTWLNLAHPEVPQCLPFRSLLGSPGSTGARKAPSLHCWLKPKLQGINCAHHISYLQTSGNNKNYSEIFRVWYDICTTSLSDCICTTSLSDLVSGRWTCSSNLDQQNIGDGGKTRLESNMWNNGNGKQIVMPNNAKHGARGLQMAAILQAVPCCTMLYHAPRYSWQVRLEVFHHVSSLAKRCLLHLLHLLASHSEFSPTALQRRSTPDRAVGREGPTATWTLWKMERKGSRVLSSERTGLCTCFHLGLKRLPLQ